MRARGPGVSFPVLRVSGTPREIERVGSQLFRTKSVDRLIAKTKESVHRHVVRLYHGLRRGIGFAEETAGFETRLPGSVPALIPRAGNSLLRFSDGFFTLVDVGGGSLAG